MKLDKNTTVAFSGHRTRRITDDAQTLSAKLDRTINDLYIKGYKCFLTGMAEGFDLLAGEAVIRAKAVHADIKLICVIPFSGQSKRFCERDIQRYGVIFRDADDTVLISEHYFKGCFHRRNDYMVDNASLLVAYYDRIPQGGTHYTTDKAMNKGLEIYNLCYDTTEPEYIIDTLPTYQTLKVAFAEPIAVMETAIFTDPKAWGAATLRQWIDSYESTRFTQISDDTAIITSEYNMNHVREWLQSQTNIISDELI